jgi:hypothetical protein
MAGILSAPGGIGGFYGKFGEAPTAQDYGDFCPPVVRDRADHGTLWLATGVFLSLVAKGVLFDSTPDQVDQVVPWMVFSAGMCRAIQKSIEYFGTLFDEPVAEMAMWKQTPLSPEELDQIDKTLMWAYLHKVVRFDRKPVEGGNTRNGKEISSLQDVQAYQRNEFLDIEHWRHHGNHTYRTGGFIAMYETMMKQGDKYIVSHLTLLPPYHLHGVEEQTGQIWPIMILRRKN